MPYRIKISFFLFLFLFMVNTKLSYTEELGCKGINDELIWKLETQGTWKTGNNFGYYRALVFRLSGEEHIYDKVQIQILEMIKKYDKEYERDIYKGKVIKCFWLDEPSFKGHVHNIYFKKINNKLMTFTMDVQMRAMGKIVLRVVYILKSDGTLKKISHTKYIDVFDNDGFYKGHKKLP